MKTISDENFNFIVGDYEISPEFKVGLIKDYLRECVYKLFDNYVRTLDAFNLEEMEKIKSFISYFENYNIKTFEYEVVYYLKYYTNNRRKKLQEDRQFNEMEYFKITIKLRELGILDKFDNLVCNCDGKCKKCQFYYFLRNENNIFFK